MCCLCLSADGRGVGHAPGGGVGVLQGGQQCRGRSRTHCGPSLVLPAGLADLPGILLDPGVSASATPCPSAGCPPPPTTPPLQVYLWDPRFTLSPLGMGTMGGSVVKMAVSPACDCLAVATPQGIFTVDVSCARAQPCHALPPCPGRQHPPVASALRRRSALWLLCSIDYYPPPHPPVRCSWWSTAARWRPSAGPWSRWRWTCAGTRHLMSYMSAMPTAGWACGSAWAERAYQRRRGAGGESVAFSARARS